MANVLHRTTKTYLRSVNTPDYPPVDWVINPDISAVTGFATKYWIITGDIVTLMDQAARDAVDAAEAAQLLTDNRLEAHDKPDEQDTGEGIHVRELIEVFNKRDNYLTNRIEEVQADLQTIKASTGPADNIRDAIRSSYLATTTRTRAEAVADYQTDINVGGAD